MHNMTAPHSHTNRMEDNFQNGTVTLLISANTTADIVASTTAEDILGPRYHKRARIAIIIVMIVASVVGNTIVCWKLIVKRRRRRMSKARVLFLNLAIADLLVACITMTSQVVWEVMGRLWIAGDAFCRLFKFLQTFALVSSTYMLVVIALDRHIAIVTPLTPNPDPWRLAAFTWLLSCLPSLPNVYVFHVVQIAPGKCFCASIFYDSATPIYHRQLYMGFVLFMVFVVPLALLVTFYTGILCTIWKHSSRSDKVGQQTASSLPLAKVKTLKMTVVVFGAFLVTNVPYMVQEVILAFGNPGVLNANVVALSGVISASNSAINPYIFLYFQKDHDGRNQTTLASLLKNVPCLRRWFARARCKSSHKMATLTVTYSGRHSRTITTANCDLASERT